MTKTTTAFASALFILAFSGIASAQALQGQASVIDGDTLDIHGKRIRLHGIDAPESDQVCTRHDGQRWRCGQQAALALDDRIGQRTVQCRQQDTDRYGRVVAECFAGGESLNRWLVAQGWAVAYRQFSTAYVGDEARARRAGAGIWSGDFTPPAEHRQQARIPAATAASAPPSGCRIKGNISAAGERVYHSPGQQHYERTRIDTAAGERWFCSPAQAEAAGWRPAKR